MHNIHKKIVTDEANHPVAVQIDYADWLEIQRLLHLKETPEKKQNIARYAGVIKLTEDPVKFQKRIRDEWM